MCHVCAPPGIFLIFVMHVRSKKRLYTIHFCNLFNVPFNNKQFRMWLLLSVLDMFILLLGVYNALSPLFTMNCMSKCWFVYQILS